MLARTDRAIRLIDRFAGCFGDDRAAALVEHPLRVLVGQRVVGIALGYEDLLDHDQLRFDPVLGRRWASRKPAARWASVVLAAR